MQHVLARRKLNLQTATTHTSSTNNKTAEESALFTDSAMAQTKSYKNSGRNTISKASGEIKESHGTIWPLPNQSATDYVIIILISWAQKLRYQNSHS